MRVRVCVCVRVHAAGWQQEHHADGRQGKQHSDFFFIIRIVSLLEACHRADAQGATELSTDSLLIF
jgi:hypothetical protein